MLLHFAFGRSFSAITRFFTFNFTLLLEFSWQNHTARIANDSEVPMDARKDCLGEALKYTRMTYSSCIGMIRYVIAKISIFDVQRRTSSYFLRECFSTFVMT